MSNRASQGERKSRVFTSCSIFVTSSSLEVAGALRWGAKSE